jgi:signal transduction histidine kinase
MRKSQLYTIAFGFSLLVLLFFSLLLYKSINSLEENSSLVEHSQNIIDKLQKLNLSMMEVETSQRGYLLSSDTTFLDLLKTSRNNIPLLLDTLKTLTQDNEWQEKNTTSLKISIIKRLKKIQEILNRTKYYSAEELAEELRDSGELMDEFRSHIRVMANEEQILMQARSKSKQAYERVTPNYFKAIFSITTIIALISFILLLNELKQRLAAQALLETRVNILARANSELQQIAHVTSHDLQEPLRKIRTFIDALRSKYETNLPEEAQSMLQRVDKNANDIKELVSDLADFTNLANKEEKAKDIDLNKILLDTQKELGGTILSKKAQLTVSPLPRINGFEDQLRILFRELITNALKFSRENVTPEIMITGNLVNGNQMGADMKFGDRNFYVLSLYDNGMGFEPEYYHKIFILFQKLHGSDPRYKGKGIGLAICQRIMANHDGFITASAEPDKGATFQLFFPTA